MGHSLDKQSASLGRATAGGADGSGGVGVGANASGAGAGSADASASVPRRNSLGDLKIPVTKGRLANILPTIANAIA